MLDFKKIAVAAMMGAAFLCSTSSMAGKCQTDQYYINNTCKSCPKGATCNGTTVVKCPSGTTQTTSNGSVTCKCNNGGYRANGKGSCIACPTGAKCNGVDKITQCPISSVTPKKLDNGKYDCSCPSDKPYIFNNTCNACPKHAECKNGKAKCLASFKDAKSGDGSLACVCESNQLHKTKPDSCVKCPQNAKCNGTTKFECLDGWTKDKDGNCTVPVCKNNQYKLSNGTCEDCPDRATCNGKSGSCKSPYVMHMATNGSGKFVCGCGEDGKKYLDGANCVACPPNAKCNSTHLVKCVSNSYYLFNKGCHACPTGATCDATNVTKCPKGFTPEKAADGTISGCVWRR